MTVDSSLDATGWTAARKLAVGLGEVPMPLANCVRMLVSSSGTSSDPFLKRLLSSAFKDAFYQFAVRFYPEAVGKSPVEIARLFSGQEIAAFLACGVMLRRVEATLPLAFATFAREAAIHIEVGALLGRAISKIGMADGMMVPAARWAGLIAIAGAEPSKVETYRAKLKTAQNFWCDGAVERATWGCTHSQVGSLLLARTGIAAERASVVSAAVDVPPDFIGADGINRTRVIAVMVEALASDMDIPELPGDEEFLMDEAKMEALLHQVALVRANGSSIRWGGGGIAAIAAVSE